MIWSPAILYVSTFVVSALLALGMTPVSIWLATKWHILDVPNSPVKTHKLPVPYLGGVAIWGSFVLSMILLRFLTHFPTGTLYNLRGLLFGGTTIMLLGVWDDVRGLDYRFKLLVEVIAALILISFGIRIHFISNPWVAIPLTVLWVVGITNSLNIIDIMDGLCAGTGFVAALALFFIALPTEAIYVNFASVALAGALLGFLHYNWQPARIFLGDAGSLFIGFSLAALSLGESYTTVNNIALFAPILVLGIPLYDTVLVSFHRMRRGKSIFEGSKDHFALRMEAMGIRRKRVVQTTLLVSACLSIAAFLITILKFEYAALVLGVVVAVGAFAFNALSSVEVKE